MPFNSRTRDAKLQIAHFYKRSRSIKLCLVSISEVSTNLQLHSIMEGSTDSDVDDKLWEFKLKLYDNDETLARKFYKEDEFCHEFVILGTCSNQYQGCQYNHDKDCIRIRNGNIEFGALKYARLLTEYLIYVYDNEDSKALFENYQLFVSNLKSFKGSFAAIERKIDTATKSFEDALKLSPESSKGEIAFAYARALCQHMNNWPKSQKMHELAIKCSPDNAFYLYKYGFELSVQQEYQEAIKMFQRALELKPGQPRYSHQLAYALYYDDRYKNRLQCKRILKNLLKRNSLRSNSDGMAMDHSLSLKVRKLLDLVNSVPISLSNKDSESNCNGEEKSHKSTISVNNAINGNRFGQNHSEYYHHTYDRDSSKLGSCSSGISGCINIDLDPLFDTKSTITCSSNRSDQHSTSYTDDKDAIFNQLGFMDKKLNLFKLELYDYNINFAVQYMKHDKFCHIFAVFGSCDCSYSNMTSDHDHEHDNTKNPKLDHSSCYRLVSMIEDEKKYEKAELYCNYFLHKYEKENENNHEEMSKENKRSLIAKIYQHLGNIYNFGSRNRDDILQSIKYYEKSHALEPINPSRDHYLATMYDEFLNDFEKAKYYFNHCIKSTEWKGFHEYTFAMAFKHRKMYDSAIEYFKKALKSKPGHVRYMHEYSYALFNKGPQYYDQALELAYKVRDSRNSEYDDATQINCERLIDIVQRWKNDGGKRASNVNASNYNEDGHKGDDSISGIVTDLETIDMKRVKTEFEHFWNQLAFVNPWKIKYYNLFKKHGLNNANSLISMCENDFEIFQKREFNMIINKIHAKYLKKQIKEWNIKRCEFEMKIEYLSLPLSCAKLFQQNDIWTFESFFRRIGNTNQLQTMITQDKENLSGNASVTAKLIWNLLAQI